MMGITHMIISSSVVSLIMQTADARLILVGAAACLLPDVDTSTSPAGRVFPWLSRWLEGRFPHRSCTHSLVASGVVALVSYLAVIIWVMPANLITALNIGYFFGYFADVFTASGCEIFWPSTVRAVWPGNRNFRLRTDSPVEYGILVVLTLVLVLSINVNASGGIMTHFNRLMANSTGVEQIYNSQGSNHLIIAHIKGVQSSDRSPVEGDFLIIEARGQDFIVQSKDGRIYKAGIDPVAQIITEQITADVSKPAITNIEPLTLDDDPLGPSLEKFSQKRATVFLSGQLSIDDSEGVKWTPDPYQFPSIKLSASSLTLEAAPLSTVLKYFRDQYATGQLQVRIINEATTTTST